jgi:RNA polymerase sigma-70 factor (ECF subfamily)
VSIDRTRDLETDWHPLSDLRPDAMRFAGWLGVPPSSREDLVQSALARVYPHAASLSDPEGLKSYLLTTVRNLWRNECRRSRTACSFEARVATRDASPLAPGPDEVVIINHDHEAVRAAFASLAPAHREALRLRYLDALDYGAVARALHVSAVAARQRVHRARRRLVDAYVRAGG